MCDPQKLSILDELRSFLGYDIRAVVATEKDIHAGAWSGITPAAARAWKR